MVTSVVYEAGWDGCTSDAERRDVCRGEAESCGYAVYEYSRERFPQQWRNG